MSNGRWRRWPLQLQAGRRWCGVWLDQSGCAHKIGF